MMRIEGVNNFTDFVKAFSQFGGEMVELAHLTGDRQNVSGRLLSTSLAVPTHCFADRVVAIFTLRRSQPF